MKRPQSLGLEQFFGPLHSRLFFFVMLLAVLSIKRDTLARSLYNLFLTDKELAS